MLPKVIAESASDVTLALEFEKQGININWYLVFKSVFPEYYVWFNENRPEFLPLAVEQNKMKIITLWMVYYHRRLLKYFARYREAAYGRHIELIYSEDGSHTSISEAYMDGKRVTRVQIAREIVHSSGLLIHLMNEDPIRYNNATPQTLIGFIRTISGRPAGKRPKFLIALRNLTLFITDKTQASRAEPILSFFKDFPRIGEPPITLGCSVCETQFSQQQFLECQDCNKIYCSKKCATKDH